MPCPARTSVYVCSYDSLTENLLDPAHVPFAHHKIQVLADPD